MNKPIRFHKQFEKHYAKRILTNIKLSRQYDERYIQFVAGKRDYPLDDHQLTGKLVGKRAFSIAGDIRVVYTETDKEIIFLDVGSHNQVY